MSRKHVFSLALAASAVAAVGGRVYAQETVEAVAPAAATQEAKASRRFDPGRMPEVKPVTPPLGYRHGGLSPSEVAALRRSFKLPLDALAKARSTSDLAQRAVSAPLPDPHRPLLSVSASPVTTANPFADTRSTSFRVDPLKALGEMLGAVEGEKPASDKTVDVPSEDPFGGADAAATEESAPVETAEVSEETDPFGESGNPFGDDASEGASEGANADEADAPAEGDDPFSF